MKDPEWNGGACELSARRRTVETKKWTAQERRYEKLVSSSLDEENTDLPFCTPISTSTSNPQEMCSCLCSSLSLLSELSMSEKGRTERYLAGRGIWRLYICEVRGRVVYAIRYKSFVTWWRGKADRKRDEKFTFIRLLRYHLSNLLDLLFSSSVTYS